MNFIFLKLTFRLINSLIASENECVKTVENYFDKNKTKIVLKLNLKFLK